jgi:hypothetical protein
MFQCGWMRERRDEEEKEKENLISSSFAEANIYFKRKICFSFES